MAPSQTVLQTLTIRFEADLSPWRAGVAQVIGESRALSGQISQAMGGGIAGAAATTGVGAALTAALVAPLGVAITHIATLRRQLPLLRADLAAMAALTAAGAATQGASGGALVAAAAGATAVDAVRSGVGRDRRGRFTRQYSFEESGDLRGAASGSFDDDGPSIGGGESGARARDRARFVRDHGDAVGGFARKIGEAVATITGLGWLGRLLAGGGAEAATATGLGAATAGLRGFGAALAALASPLGVAAAALTVLVGLWGAANWGRITEMFEEFSAEAAPQFAEALGDITSSFANFTDAIMEMAQQIFGQDSGEMIELMRNVLEFFTRTWNAIAELIGGVLNVLAEGLRAWTALMRGDWEGFWQHTLGVITSALSAISEALLSWFPERRTEWEAFWREIGEVCQRTFGATVEWLREKIEDIGGFFLELWDRVVGHSYVPDLVDGIEEHFARLQGVMVAPAQEACSAVGDAFAQVGKDVGKAANDNISAAGAMWLDLSDVFRDGLTGLVNGQEGAFSNALYNMLSRARDVVINSLFDSLQEGMSGMAQRAGGSGGGGILGAIGSLFGGGGGGGFNPAKIFTAAMLPGFANGVRNFQGGYAWVGEEGPEIVKLPGGSDVIPNHALGGPQIIYAPRYQFTGTAEEIARIERMVEQDRENFAVKVRATVGDAKARGRL